MSKVLTQIKNFLRNIFLEDVDKAYEQPETLRKKFREKRDPVERIKERHQEFQDFNKLR